MNLSFLVFGLLSIVAGALAASNVVIEKLPNSKDYINKMLPYQATIGVVAMVLSVLKLLDSFSLNIDLFTKLINFICIASAAVVGFLLGFPMVQQFIANDEKSKVKAEEFRKKLAPYQVVAGLVCIGAGAYLMVFGLFHK